MIYKCSVCGYDVDGNPGEYIDHTEHHIVEMIKDNNPDWQDDDGLCSKCYDYYKKQIKGGG